VMIKNTIHKLQPVRILITIEFNSNVVKKLAKNMVTTKQQVNVIKRSLDAVRILLLERMNEVIPMKK
jgi:hypothetical protein